MRENGTGLRGLLYTFRRNAIERELSTLANHIPNSYTLSFRPSVKTPGFHTLQVELVHASPGLTVSARSGYWFEAAR